MKPAPLIGLLVLMGYQCRYGEPKPDDSAGPVDTSSTATPWDSPQDSPVDTVTSATSDTGDAPLPVGELVLFEDAAALFVGHVWTVACGHAVSGAGDIDGDGLADIILGDPSSDWDNAGGGGTVLFSGATVGGTMDMQSDYDLRLVSLGYGEGGGASVARAGDVDGDGLDDIAMATRSAWYNGTDLEDGWLHLWWGPAGHGTVELDTATSDASVGFDSWGDPVLAGGGDVDGDGLDDLVVGLADHQVHEGGVAWIFTGPELHAWATLTGAVGDDCGASVAVVGDVDADGYDDVLVGAPQDGPAAAAGFVGLVLGSASSPGESSIGAAWLRVAGTSGEHGRTGYAVAGLGDFEGDGRGDLSIATTLRGADETWEGERALLMRGAELSAGGLVSVDDAHASFTTAERGSVRTMLTLAGPGDLDGDSLDDWLVAAPGHDGDNGVAYVFLAAGLGLGGELDALDANYMIMGAMQGAFGHSLAMVGDVDGDGRSELLMGGPDYEAAGAALLFGLPD